MENVENTQAEKKYFRLDELAARFCCTKRSIYRWMALDACPFPAPKINRQGVSPLWAAADVLAWENAGND